MELFGCIRTIKQKVATTIVEMARCLHWSSKEVRSACCRKAVESSAAVQRLMDVADEMNEKSQSLNLGECLRLWHWRLKHVDTARDRVDYIIRCDEAADFVIRGCAKRKIDKMPHAAFWKFLVELNGFLVSTEGPLIMRSNDHLVSPGSDGNKVSVPALREQLLNLCLGSLRNKTLRN